MKNGVRKEEKNQNTRALMVFSQKFYEVVNKHIKFMSSFQRHSNSLKWFSVSTQAYKTSFEYFQTHSTEIKACKPSIEYIPTKSSNVSWNLYKNTFH